VAVAFTTWFWGNKYDESAVRKLYAGVKRNYRREFRFVVIADRELRSLPSAIEQFPISDPGLIGRGCFPRIRLFDPTWQSWHGFDDVIANLDLDLVITGPLDDVFKRKESFSILCGVNKLNPNPFNGSLMMLRAGQHPEVWRDFSLEAAERAPKHEFADDQGWIWHKLPNATGWKAGPESGIYAFMKHGWPRDVGDRLPHNARIVAFVGYRKPWMFGGLPWIKQFWVE